MCLEISLCIIPDQEIQHRNYRIKIVAKCWKISYFCKVVPLKNERKKGAKGSQAEQEAKKYWRIAKDCQASNKIMMALEAKRMCEKETLDFKFQKEEMMRMMRTQQRLKESSSSSSSLRCKIQNNEEMMRTQGLKELCKMREKISMGENYENEEYLSKNDRK